MTAMPAETAFFDTSYLVRLYLEDAGFASVRDYAESRAAICAAWHAQAEVVTALHRAFRERGLDPESYQAARRQFSADREAGLFVWLPLDEAVRERLERVLDSAPKHAFLRAADGLHLACAAENGFAEVFSHDRHFLAAAPLFGLQGRDLISLPA
jgi:predicted nucleic acid-binding protein